GYYYPGELKNQSHVNDPVAADLVIRQRRTTDPAKRREIIHELQRYLAKQVYYTTSVGQVYAAVWDGALKNYGPNLGYDYGGRLVAALLERGGRRHVGDAAAAARHRRRRHGRGGAGALGMRSGAAGRRAAEAGRHPGDPRRRSAALRRHADVELQDAQRPVLHAQPPRTSQSGAVGGAG